MTPSSALLLFLSSGYTSCLAEMHCWTENWLCIEYAGRIKTRLVMTIDRPIDQWLIERCTHGNKYRKGTTMRPNWHDLFRLYICLIYQFIWFIHSFYLFYLLFHYLFWWCDLLPFFLRPLLHAPTPHAPFPSNLFRIYPTYINAMRFWW